MNITATIALVLVLALGADSPWRRVEAPLLTSFPRDHGAHEDCRTEWWYATGTAEDVEDGSRYGWQLTIFRRGTRFGPRAAGEPLLSARQVFAAHFAIADVERGAFVHAERRRRAFPGLAWASTETLDAGIEGWTMRLDDRGVLHAQAVDPDKRIALDLELAPAKPLVMHGREGVSVKGAESGNASAYMSWTRLRTTGTVTIDGRARRVRGESWFDHEWGSSQLGQGVIGWDWFGLRLEDGRELMIYRLRRKDGSVVPESSGTLVEKDGTKRHLELADFALADAGSWTSPHSQARYASRWTLKVTSSDIDVTITTMTPDCEIDAKASTGNVYWEGPVTVAGSVKGAGFGELTGYSGAVFEDL